VHTPLRWSSQADSLARCSSLRRSVPSSTFTASLRARQPPSVTPSRLYGCTTGCASFRVPATCDPRRSSISDHESRARTTRDGRRELRGGEGERKRETSRAPREPRVRVRVCSVIRVRDGKHNIEPRGTSAEEQPAEQRTCAAHIRKRNTALPPFVFAEDRRGRSSIQLERRRPQEDHVRRHASTRRQWLQEADGISCTRISVNQVTMHRRSADPMSSRKLESARRHREPSRRGGTRRGAIASLSLTAGDRERAGTRRDFGWTRIDRAIQSTRDARFRCPITRHGWAGTEGRGMLVVRHGLVASRRFVPKLLGRAAKRCRSRSFPSRRLRSRLRGAANKFSTEGKRVHRDALPRTATVIYAARAL